MPAKKAPAKITEPTPDAPEATEPTPDAPEATEPSDAPAPQPEITGVSPDMLGVAEDRIRRRNAAAASAADSASGTDD